MFIPKLTLPAIAIAALVLTATPLAIALNDGQDEVNPDLVTVEGIVTAFLYDDHDDADDEVVRTMSAHPDIPTAFLIDDQTAVKFGPWWYWMVQDTDVTDVVAVGDMVKVTGEPEVEDGLEVLCAWHIENLTTGEELTIKEEGRPPWAGGPKALGIDPWPPSDEDD